MSLEELSWGKVGSELGGGSSGLGVDTIRKPVYWDFISAKGEWKRDLLTIIRDYQEESEIVKISVKASYTLRSFVVKVMEIVNKNQLTKLDDWIFCLFPHTDLSHIPVYSVEIESFKTLSIHDDPLIERVKWKSHLAHTEFSWNAFSIYTTLSTRDLNNLQREQVVSSLVQWNKDITSFPVDENTLGFHFQF